MPKKLAKTRLFWTACLQKDRHYFARLCGKMFTAFSCLGRMRLDVRACRSQSYDQFTFWSPESASRHPAKDSNFWISSPRNASLSKVQRKFPQKCMTSKHLKGRLGLGPPIGWLDRVLTRRDPLLVGWTRRFQIYKKIQLCTKNLNLDCNWLIKVIFWHIWRGCS